MATVHLSDDAWYLGRATSHLLRDYLIGRLSGSLDVSGREGAGRAPNSAGWERGRTVVLDDPAHDVVGAAVRDIPGPGTVRVYHDLADAAALTPPEPVVRASWSPELFLGATLVLMHLPRSLDALDDMARDIAAWADEGVTLVAGGRQKYMTPAMNTVLGTYFETVDISPARSKSRLLIATSRREPIPAGSEPRAGEAEDDIALRAWGPVFGGANADHGSCLLMRSGRAVLEGVRGREGARALDLGSGNGLLTAWLARELEGVRVEGADVSAAAVRSTLATLGANDIAAENMADDGPVGRPGTVHVRWADGADFAGPGAFDLVVCNPPFHRGGAVDRDAAVDLLASGARALAPGGAMVVVFNSALRYRKLLESLVGPVEQLGRDPRFTVVVARRPGQPTPPGDEAGATPPR